MKKLLVLSLLLVLILGTGVGALESKGIPHQVDVVVHVEPYAILELGNLLEMTISEGSSEEQVSVSGTLVSNTGFNLKFEFGSFENQAVDRFFRYLLTRKDSNSNKHIGKYSPNTQTTININQGLTNLEIGLEYNVPDEKEWYDLTAGTFKSTVTITIAASNPQ